MSVFAKILEARQQIHAVKKTEKKGISFDYQGISEVTHALKQVFDSVGLLFLPSNTSIELVGDSWVLGYDMVIVDAFDDSTWVAKWYATIPAEQFRKNGENLIDDKATGKAHSYAVKYFLMKTFMITDKEDVANDIDSIPDPIPAQPSKPKNVTPAPQKPATPKRETPATKLDKRNKKLQVDIIKASNELWGKDASDHRHKTVSLMTATATENINDLTDEEATRYLQMVRADAIGKSKYAQWIETVRAELVEDHSRKRTSNLYKMANIKDVNTLLVWLNSDKAGDKIAEPSL